MADKGGVAGIYLMPFLDIKGTRNTELVIRHIEHALKVCGEDHVGIGSDLSIQPISRGAEIGQCVEIGWMLARLVGRGGPLESSHRERERNNEGKEFRHGRRDLQRSRQAARCVFTGLTNDRADEMPRRGNTRAPCRT